MKVSKKATQKLLPGVEAPEIIQEITDAAMGYHDLIEQRKEIQKRERKAKLELLQEMKTHKLKKYRDPEAGLMVELEQEEPKLHVSFKTDDEVPEGAKAPGSDMGDDDESPVEDVKISVGTLASPELPVELEAAKPKGDPKPKRSHKAKSKVAK